MLSAPLSDVCRVGHDLLIEGSRSERFATYWSPRDPLRLRSIDFLDWRLRERNGDLFVFWRPYQNEYLYWVWGATTAVRSNLNVEDKCKPIYECNGAALITYRDRKSRFYSVYALDLKSKRAQNYLPPAELPVDAPFVEAVWLLKLRGGPSLHPVLGHGGELEAPYVALRHGRALFEIK